MSNEHAPEKLPADTPSTPQRSDASLACSAAEQQLPEAGDITAIVETEIAPWLEAKRRANPHGFVTVVEEFEMRRCITELELSRRGLPLDACKHQPGNEHWDVHTYLDAQRNAITEAPWKIKGIVVEGSATQVSAHPHGMKSLSWLGAALEAVTTHRVWSHFDAGKVERVLYIESEDPEWMVAARIRGIAKGIGLPADKDVPGFHFVCPGPFDLVSEESTLLELFAKHRPDFTVLSTLQSVLGGRDWQNQKDMQAVNALIVRLSRICPLVVLTHSPWDKRRRRAAGTITQFANFAIAMHYERIKLSAGGVAIHVLVDSKVGASIDGFHLKLLTEGDEDDPSSVRGLVYGGEGRPKGAGREAALEALAEDPEASAAEIAERVGVSERYVRKLSKDDRAKKKSRPRTKGSRSHQVDVNDPSSADTSLRLKPDADAFAGDR
jgi:AAA domain